MLVLTRRLDESILIGDTIEIKVLQIRGSGDQAVVRIGITAPKAVTVLRKEVYDEVVSSNQQAAHIITEIPVGLLSTVEPATPKKKD